MPGGQQQPQLIRQTPRNPWHKRDLKEIIDGLGLGSNLKLCLDAGDGTSLPAASTKWVDLSGNGYDFFRGTTAGADATDPTINGSAGGLSSSEYLSFDGGDYLRYDAANEAWMNNLHKDSASFWFVGWVYIVAAASNIRLFGTNNNDLADIGIRFTYTAADVLSLQVSNGSGVTVRNAGSGASLIPTAGAWQFLCLSVDEATAFGRLGKDGVYVSFTSTYTSPSAAAADWTMEIAAAGNGNVPVPSGTRFAMVAMGEGGYLTEAQMTAIYTATRGRFGV